MPNKIVKVTALNERQILFATSPTLEVSVCVGNTGIEADANGKKILKAGTPMTGNMEARTTAFVKETTTSGTSNANCILLHDVDVTAGTENAAVLVLGAVDTTKVESSVASMYTAAVKNALKGIYFMA